MITQEQLKDVLSYNPETGDFTWLKPQGLGGRNGKVGAIAGSLSSQKYWVIRLNRVLYLAHRLAYLYVTGGFPLFDIDHEDLNRSNNKWNNIRNATRGQNMMNGSKRKDNTSGYKGVSLDKRVMKWRARVNLAGKEIFLGLFDDKEMAALARKNAAEKFHKEFMRTE